MTEVHNICLYCNAFKWKEEPKEIYYDIVYQEKSAIQKSPELLDAMFNGDL